MSRQMRVDLLSLHLQGHTHTRQCLTCSVSCAASIVSSSCKFVNAFWAANLHRRVSVCVSQRMVCEEKRSSKLTPAMRWLTWPLNTTKFRHTKPRGQVCRHVKSCARRCAPRWSIHTDTRESGCTVAPTSSFCWHTTWPCIPLLSCSAPLFPVLLCFLLLYGAASSSSDPQEAIHFLIICTSNRGRHRDADHKFSPPPLRCGAIAQQQLPLIGAVGSNC